MKQQNVIYALGAFKSTCTMILTPFFDRSKAIFFTCFLTKELLLCVFFEIIKKCSQEHLRLFRCY